MKGLEIIRQSAPTVRENLALDVELASNAVRDGRRVLRLWWGGPPAAVLGCADKPERDLDTEACKRLGVEIIKRVTGGGTVLETRTVFNYSYTAPDPGSLDIKHTFATGARLVIEALATFGVTATQQGTSDITVGDRKISGNAQARKWRAILLHGTLLLDIDRELMEAVLKHPPREPDYRGGRGHSDFIVTLKELGVSATQEELEDAFAEAGMRILGD